MDSGWGEIDRVHPIAASSRVYFWGVDLHPEVVGRTGESIGQLLAGLSAGRACGAGDGGGFDLEQQQLIPADIARDDDRPGPVEVGHERLAEDGFDFRRLAVGNGGDDIPPPAAFEVAEHGDDVLQGLRIWPAGSSRKMVWPSASMAAVPETEGGTGRPGVRHRPRGRMPTHSRRRSVVCRRPRSDAGIWGPPGEGEEIHGTVERIGRGHADAHRPGRFPAGRESAILLLDEAVVLALKLGYQSRMSRLRSRFGRHRGVRHAGGLEQLAGAAEHAVGLAGSPRVVGRMPEPMHQRTPGARKRRAAG